MAEPKPYYGLSKILDKSKKRKELEKERAQAKKDYQNKKSSSTAVSGTMKDKQVDTTIGPKMSVDKKPVVKKTTTKKEETKTYQDAKLNESNAPRPNYTKDPIAFRTGPQVSPKKEMSTMEKAKDIIGVGREATEKEKMGRSLQDAARRSMGMKKGGSVKCKRDGCAVRGKTKGKLY